MEWLRQLAGLVGRKDSNVPVPDQSNPPSIPAAQSGKTPEPAAPDAPDTVRLKQPEAPQAPAPIEIPPEIHDIVRRICAEAFAARRDRYQPVNLENSPRWVALKFEPPEIQAMVAWAAYLGETDRNSPFYWKSVGDGEPRIAIFKQGFRRKLPFKAGQLHALLDDWHKSNLAFDRPYTGAALMGAVERLAKRQTLPPEICAALERIDDLLAEEDLSGRLSESEAARLQDRIERLLSPPKTEREPLPEGPFMDALTQWGKALGVTERTAWGDLLSIWTEASDKSKPGAKWLESARPLIEAVGPVRLAGFVVELLAWPMPDPRQNETYDESLYVMRGILWTTVLLDHGIIAGELGRFAEKWFQWPVYWRGGGYSARLDNAALWALSEMAGEPRAAAELFRLREKIKQHGQRKLIGRRLAELAEKDDTTVGALEDFSLPAFGLDENSTLSTSFGETRCELAVEATKTVQRWIDPAGKPVKSPPAEVRDGFAKALAAHRQQAKDIEAARQLQAARLEQSWAEERSWAFSDWETNFLRHPLRRPIVASLIWRIGDKTVLPAVGALQDAAGNAHTFGPDARVSLWHPVDADPEDVLAWRARILERGLTQPIKQAHREIYVLTEAERTTRTYSNRFAAHILRQHQFSALCQARGWRYKLMGDWDGWNMPTRSLPGRAMTAEYHVETIEEADGGTSGVAAHLTSDQVRFLDPERLPVPLESVPPIVFSEVMRDMDLFVAVTSVANDPNWSDGGPNGRYGDYWRQWAFGDLGQTAATRRELAIMLVSKLSIADKLEVTDKFLVVKGKRQKYAIHFGSSNIQILPSNRYLCIVPARATKEVRDIKLPFEGDSLFSTILSKAFLLVDEDKIEDETILRQL